MPISSGPIGLTRTYQAGYQPEGLVTWNQPGLRTHKEISSLHVLERPLGAGVSRDVNILFGHAQLIPTFTLKPKEEYKAPASDYLDASHAPAPRNRKSVARSPSHGSPIRAEGDTHKRLGMHSKPTEWENSLIKPTDSHRPLGRDVPLELKRGPTSARSRSRSPTGQNRLSARAPKQLSSSLQSQSAASLRAAAFTPIDAAASADISRGTFRSPHAKDLERTRKYVRALDEELRTNAREAWEAEKKALQANQVASIERERKRDAEWNRDLMMGVHVRAVGMERQWHQPQGMERISGLYHPANALNTSTDILQDSLHAVNHSSNNLYDPSVSEADLMNRSTVVHSPKHTSGAANVSYRRDREEQKDSMPDKSMDLGFVASGKRHHEEAMGGKQIIKSRVWPRDPVGNQTGGKYDTSIQRDMHDAHGVNTSTTSARVRAQQSGEINADLSASFSHSRSIPSSPHTGGGPQSVNISNLVTDTPSSIRRRAADTTNPFQLHPAVPVSAHASPRSASTGRPISASPRQQQQLSATSPRQQNSAVAGLPYADHHHPSVSVERTSFHTNESNTSSAAMLNNSVTHASMEAQKAHAAKYTPSGNLRAHPRNFADDFLRDNGIHMSQSFTSSSRGGLDASTGDILLAPSLHASHNIEGNGAILDLAPAIRARAKAPWKYGGAQKTRRHDRKVKNEEDLVLSEAQKRRLPSSRTRPASAPAHRIGHRVSGGPGFVVASTSLKPSIKLQSGHNIIGRTRVTPRVNLTSQDWAYLKAKEKASRARAYSASRRGPHDPRPHNTSVIEEAMALEKEARRERELVAREREWRAQQIWLHEKKKGMDRMAAKAASEKRRIPKRPARTPPPKDDSEHISAAAGGAAKPWGNNLIAPAYMDSMARVAHDIDVEAHVRGKDSITRRNAIVNRAHRAANQTVANSSADWNSKHQLTEEDLSNPLVDDETHDAAQESKHDEQEGQQEEDDEPALPSNSALDRAHLERGEHQEFLRVKQDASAVASEQDARDRAALRAQIVAESIAHADEARRRAREAELEEQVKEEELRQRARMTKIQFEADQRRGIPIGKRATNLSFTASPRKSGASAASSTARSSTGAIGASSLLIAESYDRRMKDMISFLRRRHPYMNETERQERAMRKAREMVESEIMRMGKPSAAATAASRAALNESGVDWFTEYQSSYVESDDDATSASVDPHRESAHHQAELDELRRSTEDVQQRYQRIQDQATEAHRL